MHFQNFLPVARALFPRRDLGGGSISPSQTVWQIPLVGLSDTVTEAWGINVTIDNVAGLRPVIVNNGTTSLSTVAEIQPGLLTIGGETIQTNTLEYGLNSQNELLLGTNSPIEIISTSTSSIGQNSTPTVPFGLNLGHEGSWNGALVLGGDYDQNRVTGGNWSLVIETANGNSTFLNNGQQALNNVTRRLTVASSQTDATYAAIIDLNNDAIVLPNQEGRNLCTDGFSVMLNIKSGLTMDPGTVTIDIPANLTASAGRCTYSNDSLSEIITLGRPFFQATYFYVDTQGQMWLNPAHQDNLDPSLVQFNSSDIISTYSEPILPSSTVSPHSSFWKQHADTIIIASAASAFGLIVITGLVLCILRRKHQKRERDAKKRREIEEQNVKMHSRNQSLESNYSQGTVDTEHAMLKPPPKPKLTTHQISVFETDDDNSPTVMKRTKTFLKSLKRKDGRAKARADELEIRVVRDGARANAREGPNVPTANFEDLAWDHDHTTVYDVGIAVGAGNRI